MVKFEKTYLAEMSSINRRTFLSNIGKAIAGISVINPTALLSKTFSAAVPLKPYWAIVTPDFKLNWIESAKSAVDSMGSIAIPLSRNVTAFALHPDVGDMFFDQEIGLSLKIPSDVAATLKKGADLSGFATTYYEGLFNNPTNAAQYIEKIEELNEWLSSEIADGLGPEYVERYTKTFQDCIKKTMEKHSFFSKTEIPKDIKISLNNSIERFNRISNNAKREIEQKNTNKSKISSGFKSWAQMEMPYRFHTDYNKREYGDVRGTSESYVNLS